MVMKLKIIVTILILLHTISVISQNITGIVYEMNDKKETIPIAGATVFWTGTTIGTSTNANGEYKLSNKGINDHHLVYMDPKKPLVVRKTPDYMEGGGTGASINAPGPYDKYANTFYNVSPPTHLSDADAESFLREYNYYTLQILSIHEALPGHYVQLMHANMQPSIIKNVFGNTAMVEGWAVYGERMMIENGYGDNAPEMQLMYYKWNLRETLNTILDYSVHCLNMSEGDVMNLLMKEGFQEKTEATNKWKRVRQTQVQLDAYFTGSTEVLALREDYKKSLGDKYNLYDFNNKFLSYGSVPVKYISQMMMAELKK